MATYRERNGRVQVQVRRQGGPPLTRTFDTKTAAERWARQQEAAIERGEAPGRQPRLTLGELIARHREETPRIGRSKAAVLASLERELGHLRLRELTPETLIRWGRARAAAGAGPATLAIDLVFLAGVLRTARVVWRLPVDDAPVRDARAALAHLGLVGRSRERERRPSRPELAALLAHFRANARASIPVADIAEFAVASGMRLGEICRIRWADLDPGRRVILVRDRKDPRRKAGNDQLVPLLDKTGLDALAIILRQPRRGELIFPYKPQSVSRAWQRACAALGITDLHEHDLRAEAATRLFEAGLAVQEVARVTGHREWRTLQRYERTRAEDLPARYPAAPLLATPARPPPRTGEGPAGEADDPPPDASPTSTARPRPARPARRR